MEKEFYNFISKGVRRKDCECLLSCNYGHEDEYDNVTYCQLFNSELEYLEKVKTSPFEFTRVMCCQECNKFFGVKDVH